MLLDERGWVGLGWAGLGWVDFSSWLFCCTSSFRVYKLVYFGRMFSRKFTLRLFKNERNTRYRKFKLWPD
jgi:hypothetical protein